MNQVVFYLLAVLCISSSFGFSRKRRSSEDDGDIMVGHSVVDNGNDDSDDNTNGDNGNNGMGGNVMNTCVARRYANDMWVFGSYHVNNEPYTYYNSNGRFVGHDIEIVKDVCRIAGQRCEVIVVPVSYCVEGVGTLFQPGSGIRSGYLDGCTAIWNTDYRNDIVDFTMAYKPVRKTYFYRRPGDVSFDPTNIAGKTIAEVGPWASRVACLRNGGFSGFITLTQERGLDAINAVKNGLADAMLSTVDSTIAAELEQVGEGWFCSDGAAIMTPKGSAVPHWWDQAFRKYAACGCYKKQCEKTTASFGQPIRCFEFTGGSCTNAERMMYCP